MPHVVNVTDKRTIPDQKRLRSSLDKVFNWKEDCFLCDKPCDGKKGKFKQVMTIKIRQNVIESATNRNDEWGEKLNARLHKDV